jgi:hypothetical protein
MTDWNELLNDWKSRVTDFQARQQKAGIELEKRHYSVGIPATIFAAIAGTTVFANLTKSFSYNARLAVVIISVTTAVLSALQTFLNFGKRSEEHRSNSARLGDIRRMVDIELQFPPETVEGKRAALEKINREIAAVTDKAPLVEVPIFPQAPAPDPQPQQPSSGGTGTGGTGSGGTGSGGTSGSQAFSTPTPPPRWNSPLPQTRWEPPKGT